MKNEKTLNNNNVVAVLKCLKYLEFGVSGVQTPKQKNEAPVLRGLPIAIGRFLSGEAVADSHITHRTLFIKA